MALNDNVSNGKLNVRNADVIQGYVWSKDAESANELVLFITFVCMVHSSGMGSQEVFSTMCS